jgi:hypothetical protein
VCVGDCLKAREHVRRCGRGAPLLRVLEHGRLLLASEKLIQHFQLLVYDALDGS